MSIQELMGEMQKASDKAKKDFDKITFKYQRRTRDVINNEK